MVNQSCGQVTCQSICHVRFMLWFLCLINEKVIGLHEKDTRLLKDWCRTYGHRIAVHFLGPRPRFNFDIKRNQVEVIVNPGSQQRSANDI